MKTDILSRWVEVSYKELRNYWVSNEEPLKNFKQRSGMINPGQNRLANFILTYLFIVICNDLILTLSTVLHDMEENKSYSFASSYKAKQVYALFDFP